jgi:hypothetical protein
MRTIPLTQGQYATVDDCDYEYLRQHKWCAVWRPSVKSYYAHRYNRDNNGRACWVLMHRVEPLLTN